MPVQLDQFHHVVFLGLHVGVELLDAHPHSVFGVVDVVVGRPVEQQLQEQQVFLCKQV